MSARYEFERRLESAKVTVQSLQSQITKLEEQKASALSDGNAAKAVEINRQLPGLKQQLDDVWITVKACESRISTYKENQPQAAKVREEISAAWSQLVDVAAGMSAEVQQARKAIIEGLARTGSLEAEINNLSAKHMQLVGETLRIPDWSLTGRAYHDALNHLVDNSFDAPVSPWTYVSESERRAATAKQQAEAKAAQTARVKVAIEQAPACAVCKKPMTLRRYVSNDGEARPGSGTWEYEHCSKMATKEVPETKIR